MKRPQPEHLTDKMALSGADARRLELEALFGITPEWIPPSREGLLAQKVCCRKAALLSTFLNEVKDCRQCRLADSRTRFVFGEGDPDAEILFVGEAPGREEDRRGLPFVGAAGQILNRLVNGMGLARSDVYIGNIIKCRPPGNRKPRPDEMAACIGYLHRQIDIIDPIIIVALGAVAAQGLLALTLPVGKMRGRTFEFRARPVLVTYHPAYILRNPSAESQVAGDLRIALEYVRAHPKRLPG